MTNNAIIQIWDFSNSSADTVTAATKGTESLSLEKGVFYLGSITPNALQCPAKSLSLPLGIVIPTTTI